MSRSRGFKLTQRARFYINGRLERERESNILHWNVGVWKYEQPLIENDETHRQQKSERKTKNHQQNKTNKKKQ